MIINFPNSNLPSVEIKVISRFKKGLINYLEVELPYTLSFYNYKKSMYEEKSKVIIIATGVKKFLSFEFFKNFEIYIISIEDNFILDIAELESYI